MQNKIILQHRFHKLQVQLQILVIKYHQQTQIKIKILPYSCSILSLQQAFQFMLAS